MKEIELAYLAGVMDSDGFISIKRHAPNQNKPCSITYSEFTGVGQTSPEAVELFAKYWGGVAKIRTHKAKHGSNGWKPVYYWVVMCKSASKCIKDLRPYLRVKVKQADLLLELRRSKELPVEQRRTIKVSARNRALNPEVIEHRNQLWQEIRQLNDRRSSQAMMFRSH